MAPPQVSEPRYNERIRAREVRVIGPEGSQLGIKTLPDALSLARELDLDLVEVAPLATPPVCRIMDFGKWRYEESQKAKESRKKATHISIKEVKFRPKIGKGDFDTKVRHIIDFLDEGHKVKVTLQFRGREMAHPELGTKVLNKVAEESAEVGKVEAYPRQDGRNMTMVLAPDKKPLPKKEKVAEPGDAPTPASDSDAPSTPAPATDPVAVAEVAEVPPAAEPAATETPAAEVPAAE